MSTTETGRNNEKSAKELLYAMQPDCPEKVWQELSFELEQRGGSSEGNLKVSRKTILIIALVLLIGAPAVFILVKYSTGLSEPPVKEESKPLSIQAPAAAPVVQQQLAKAVPPPAAPDTVNAKKELAAVTKRTDTVKDKKDLAAATKRRDTVRKDSQSANHPHKEQASAIQVHQDDSVARSRRLKQREEARKSREEYAAKRRSRVHSAAGDTLNTHFYHMVNKEPFPTDSGGR
ncbi:MAG: hypothetical protein HKL88_03455 [Bacteroidia bacterium]|nr:hypothetical protein [Bacteroidia bacterium]